MTIGRLKKNTLGRWEIVRNGHEPYELSSGSTFFVETNTGALRMTRIESRQFLGPLTGGMCREYYSVDGYQLADGLRAARANEAIDELSKLRTIWAEQCQMCPALPALEALSTEMREAIIHVYFARSG
jgi:hypothetical protein